MSKNEESRALTLVKWISDKAIDGVRPLSSAYDLAEEYLIDRGYKNHGSRVDALINWETTKNFTSGFVTGLGGVLVLPFSLPTAFAASWIIQARMAAAIARIYGHNIHSDRVRTFVMTALVGDSLKDIAKASGIVISRGLAKTLIEKVPGKVLIGINKQVGFRLLTKAGEKGAINLMRGVPLVGGVVGGTFDAVACRVVGGNARALFARRPQRAPKKPRTARPRATRARVRGQRTRSAEKMGSPHNSESLHELKI